MKIKLSSLDEIVYGHFFINDNYYGDVIVYDTKKLKFIIYTEKNLDHGTDLLDYSTLTQEELFQESTIYNLPIPMNSLIVLQKYIKSNVNYNITTIEIDDITNVITNEVKGGYGY